MDEASTKGTLYDIFTLNHVLNKVFFKGFEEKNPFQNINYTHIKSMITLYFEGPCQMSYVSEKMGLEKGSFSAVAHRLIDLEYIKKIQDVNDKRVFIIELTDSGKSLAEKVINMHRQFIKDKIDTFSDIEKDVYYSAVKLIISMTEKLI